MSSYPSAELLGSGHYGVRLPGGNLARDANCEVWLTHDREKAVEAAAFIRLDHAGRKRGAHWLKSTFGVEG